MNEPDWPPTVQDAIARRAARLDRTIPALQPQDEERLMARLQQEGLLPAQRSMPGVLQRWRSFLVGLLPSRGRPGAMAGWGAALAAGVLLVVTGPITLPPHPEPDITVRGDVGVTVVVEDAEAALTQWLRDLAPREPLSVERLADGSIVLTLPPDASTRELLAQRRIEPPADDRPLRLRLMPASALPTHR